MVDKPTILSPQQPMVDGQGLPTRQWWRAFNSLFTNHGTTAAPLVTAPNAILNDVTLSGGGTISSPDVPALSLIGNPTNTPAQPTAVPVSSELINDGTLTPPSLPSGTLAGNYGPTTAPAGAIIVGDNLTLSATGTLSAPGDVDDQTLLYSIRDTSGQISATDRRLAGLETHLGTIRDSSGEIANLERKINDALILAMLPSSEYPDPIEIAAGSLFGNAGTVVAPGSNIAIGANLSLSAGGTLSAVAVTSIVIASSAFLNSGTITGAGTISSPTLAAQSLIGNSLTVGAQATPIAIGAGLTLVGGTLSAA